MEQQQQVTKLRQSSLNEEEDSIISSASVENKRISELVRSNMEKKAKGAGLQEMGWDPLGLNVKKESLTEE